MVDCLVEDPITKRQQPRNYIDALEHRVAQLEDALAQQRPSAQSSPLAASEVSPQHSQRLQTGDDLIASDTFASRVATLGLNAGGLEPRYLGPSSAFSFSRIISSSLLKAAPVKHNDNTAAQVEETSQQIACLLPEYESAVALSNAYFRSIQQQYPFLYEPTFREWENDMLSPGKQISSSDYLPLFFLYAVGT